METGGQRQPAQEDREKRRRRRERIIIVITIGIILLLTYAESHLARVEKLVPVSNEILIFGLININFILILLLIFLIVRNIVKVVFERRKGILGSKLSTKLVLAFISLSLIPTIVLFLVAIKFLSYSIDRWFNVKIVSALSSSLEIAQDYYQEIADTAKGYARQFGSEITASRLYEDERRSYLDALVKNRQSMNLIDCVEIYLEQGKRKLLFRTSGYPDISILKSKSKALGDVYRGKDFSTVESLGAGDVISGFAPVFSAFNPSEIIGAVIVSYFIPEEMVDKMNVIARTSEEYRQFALLKNPIKISYMVILFVVTLLIIFSATWFGIYLARGITMPIQDLAEATGEIARGNLNYHIDVLADDEIGILVDSFNRMTRDLATSSASLRAANMDLDQRRKYMETILRNVSAGVVSVDRNGVITTINRAAERMLGIRTNKVLYRKYEEVLKGEHMDMALLFLKEMNEMGGDSLEKQVQLNVRDRLLSVLVAMTVLRDDDLNYMGLVVVFEDLTELQKAERLAAWREIARRMAHEIKNPLTPIQLCAERLQRRYGEALDVDEDRAVFRECTGTIVHQVAALKNLVNEFSRFARMPVTRPEPNDLNQVIRESLALYGESHKAILFHCEEDPSVPPFPFDGDQIQRVLVNLLDNAVDAITSSSREGRVDVRTKWLADENRVCVEVSDDGPGIPPQDKARMFEPYFSTKKSGTGLGLAIVDAIIRDHGGTITVRDNTPKGTTLSFKLPVPETTVRTGA